MKLFLIKKTVNSLIHYPLPTTHSVRIFLAFLSFLLAFIGGLHAPKAWAQSPGFTVSPVKTFIQLHRGAAQKNTFIIVNRSQAPLPLQVVTRIFSVSDEFGSIDFSETQGVASPENAEAWLALQQPFLLLKEGESRQVQYTITIPADAPFGTYSIVALFQSKFPAADEQVSSAQLLPGIGALFFVDIVPRSGEELPAAGVLRVENFSIPKERNLPFHALGASLINTFRFDHIVEKSPITFGVELKNESRYIARPTGSLVVTDLFGRKIGLAVFPAGAVLPAAERSYAVSFEKTQRLASLTFTPDFIKQSFLPGRYTAELRLVSNAPYTQSPKVQKLIFWAFPRAFMLSTVLPLTVLAIFVVLCRRRFVIALKAFFSYGQNH